MADDGSGRVARAILFFSAFGGAIGAAIILAIAAVAVLVGEPIGLGEILPPLGGAASLGGLVGAGFAAGIAALGRNEASEGLPRWKAGLAGAIAGFVVPLLVMGTVIVASGDLQVPIAELVEQWARGGWWLLGVGGAVGVGLNEVARRPELKPGERGVVAHASAALPSGDA